MISLLSLTAVLILGCYPIFPGHHGVHTHRSRGLTVERQKDFGFEVSPRTRTLHIRLEAEFPSPVKVQFIGPDQQVAHEQRIKQGRWNLQMDAVPGKWTVRLLTDQSVTGDYYCRMVEER